MLRTKARIYLAQGTADTAVSVRTHDVLVAELLARGRDVKSERLDGADHVFRTPEMPANSPAGMQAVFRNVLDWFSTGRRGI